MPAPERNAPCTCGSGVKFKKCCGSPAVRQQIEREDAAERERQHEETMARLRASSSRRPLATALAVTAMVAT